MYAELTEYFHKGIVSDELKKIDFAALNSKAVLFGYVIHPDCCNEAVDEWLDTLTLDYNSTFYKEWDDVLNKSRFELFLDQILHYATTYGTGFSLGNGYVPNDGGTVPAFKELKVIEPITEQEMYNKCIDVLNSGIALKESTGTVLSEFVEFFVKKVGFDEDAIISMLTDIKNKEVQSRLSVRFGLFPNDEFGILRCLMYLYTGSSMLIKSREFINLIRRSAQKNSYISRLKKNQLVILSRIFYRFKPLFIAMKNEETAYTVNSLRRLAKSNHRPFNIGFWENIISTRRPLEDVCNRLEELDNFRKIRLLMLVRERIMFETKSGVFKIRNGKMFVRENYSPKYDLVWLGDLFLTIKASLVNSLKKKACSVRIPKNINIVLPTSEKDFVGNFPFGSSFKMSENNVVGVYWRNEWGTNDYDLSMIDMNGRLLSWRGSYYNSDNSLVFSGDMTNAEPEASEMFFIKNEAPDSVIKLNKFRGNDKSKFRFFYANEIPSNYNNLMNYMVDPNNVKFDTMVDFEGPGEKTIGVIFDNEFYFMDFKTGYSRVSSSGKYVNTVIDSFKRKAKCFIGLEEILRNAGFTICDDPEKDVDIDFTKLEKDTLIKLLSNEG